MPPAPSPANFGPAFRPPVPESPLHPSAEKKSASTERASRPSSTCFRERYCLFRGLTQEQYTDAMLRECLHRAARWLRFLLPPDFFTPDRDFINAFGLIRHRSEALAETREFQLSDANRHRFLRRWLRLRLSSHRVRQTLHACWEN